MYAVRRSKPGRLTCWAAAPGGRTRFWASPSAIHESGTLARCQRDTQAVSRHIAMSPNNYILGGRIGLGLDPGTTRF